MGPFGGRIFESWCGGFERVGEMIGLVDAFSTSFIQARVKFLEAAATAGLQFESFNLSQPGKDGVILALDAALQKPENSTKVGKLLIVNAANKAADSLGGSAVQVFVLRDAEWMAKVRAAGITVLYLHGSDQSLADVVQKHVADAEKVVLVDVSIENSLKNTVHEVLTAAKLAGKCKFIEVKPFAKGIPAWEGQTISLARQALFKAVDELTGA